MLDVKMFKRILDFQMLKRMLIFYFGGLVPNYIKISRWGNANNFYNL